jgi:predicted Fe-Mo cluster-binding NifX family protein
MAGLRIAIVSTDGTNVNDHFGMAKRFLIYDCNGEMTLVEERQTESLSAGDPDHTFDTEKFGRIASRLKDCSRIYITKIGDTPAAKLRGMGVEPVIYEGHIKDIPK